MPRDLQQLYLSLGTRGFRYDDPRRWALFVLNTLLGGGMSSRLFQSIREEAGLAYSVFSAADFHRDCGSLTIHLGVSPERAREALGRLRHELDLLITAGPEPAEVESAKAQLKGSIIMSQESVTNRMVNIARQELYTGHYTPPETQVEQVLAVTLEDVWSLARQLLRPEGFTLTALGPERGGLIDEGDWPVDAPSGSAARA